MASQAPQPLHPVDAETLADANDERIAAFDEATDAEAATPVRPATNPEPPHRMADAASPYRMIIGGIVAVLLGGAVGYWLGARRSQQPARAVKRAASKAEHAVELLPVAMQLLANPVVRALMLRMVMRRLGR